MAYSSTNPLVMMHDALSLGAPRVFSYQSTHNSTDILASGFFAGCGDGGRGSNNVGLRLADIVINRASTDNSIAGRVTMHSVTASTASFSSTLASSAYATVYNVSVASAT